MKVYVDQGLIQTSSADTLIVNLFAEGVSLRGAILALDQALEGKIQLILQNGDFRGKKGEVVVVYPHKEIAAKRVIIVGLGKREAFDVEGVRQASAVAIKRAVDINAKNVATIVHGAGIDGFPVNLSAQATTEGALLALYRFTASKQDHEEERKLESIRIVEADESKISDIKEGVRIAEAVVSGVYLTRDLVNMPPNVATPTKLADVAEEIANTYNMNLLVGDREWAAAHQMGAYLSVAKGAGEPPKFIVIEHNGERNDLATVVLIGKGITFDSGGISIKPSDGMGEMKSDMAGAAAVLGTMKSVGILNLPFKIIGIAPCTENMPDASAYRPSDIVTASNGKTIEIISTDAEGRLILADALVYAKKYNPMAVIDLATLTGACVIALGKGIAAGLFSNDQNLQEKLVASGEVTHDRVWPMPLWDDYKKAIKSEVADMKNTGGRNGGVGASAIFLKEFIDYPWVHLDIAGMAFSDKDDAYIPAGGTGYGVRLLVDFLRNL